MDSSLEINNKVLLSKEYVAGGVTVTTGSTLSVVSSLQLMRIAPNISNHRLLILFIFFRFILNKSGNNIAYLE